MKEVFYMCRREERKTPGDMANAHQIFLFINSPNSKSTAKREGTNRTFAFCRFWLSFLLSALDRILHSSWKQCYERMADGICPSWRPFQTGTFRESSLQRGRNNTSTKTENPAVLIIDGLPDSKLSLKNMPEKPQRITQWKHHILCLPHHRGIP